MPLGHFSISIVNSCQQTVARIQAQKAAAVKESLQQYNEYSDDSPLTTLTNTPVLSDMELPAAKSPLRGSGLSDTPRYDGSTSTPRKSRNLHVWQTPRKVKQATPIKLALSAASPSRKTKGSCDLSTKANSSVVHGLATATSPTQRYTAQDGRGGSKVPALVAANEQRIAPDRFDRPRRMAIAESEFDQLHLRPLSQGSESSNTVKSILDNLDQGLKDKQTSGQHQHLKDPTQESGNGTIVPVPYYKAERVFKWKILERPGYEGTPKASRATGSQERKSNNAKDCQRPPVTGAQQSPAAKQSPAPQRPSKAQGQAAQPREAILIPDDSDGDVKSEDAAQSTPRPETHLDSSTIRRLRDSGLLGRSRRR